jgi:hypothetical protein
VHASPLPAACPSCETPLPASYPCRLLCRVKQETETGILQVKKEELELRRQELAFRSDMDTRAAQAREEQAKLDQEFRLKELEARERREQAQRDEAREREERAAAEARRRDDASAAQLAMFMEFMRKGPGQ